MLQVQGKYAIGLLMVLMNIFFLPGMANAQTGKIIKGKVTDENGQGIENSVLIFLPGGKPQFSDSGGNFVLEKPEEARILVVSASGFHRDSLEANEDYIIISLKPLNSGKSEILITADRNPGQLNYKNAILELNIDRNELRKAACCNLSESFESSPMVDVSFPDPVSGIRQIKMLGLGSQYTVNSIENQLNPSGVLGGFSAGLIPGPWLESIQVQKGIGPVSSGYGSLAGQINSNFLQSDTAGKTEWNAFQSSMGRTEANVVIPVRRSISGGTSLFLHSNYSWLNMDENNDGYRDFPIGNQFNAMLRSSHSPGKNGTLKLAANAYKDERIGGSTLFDGKPGQNTDVFGFHSELSGLDFSGKAGQILKSSPYRSIGVQWNGSVRSNRQMAGINQIDLNEGFLSLDPVFQADVGKRGSGIKSGLTFTGRTRKETVIQSRPIQEKGIQITERKAGAFIEITSAPAPGFLLVAGSRMDWHNYYGWRHSPRLHLRYESPDGFVFRLAAGQAWQDPEIISQNLGYFSSGRKLEIETNEPNLPYGLKCEKGRSAGISASYNYRILPGKGSIFIDAYFSQIENQALADAEESGVLRIFNSKGISESRSLSVQMDQKLGRLISIRMAYRFSGSWAEYTKGRLALPMQSFHRMFAHVDLHPGSGFVINSTLQLHGPKRIFGTDNYSPAFVNINGQISKAWENKVELALGFENLTNFRQEELVIFPDEPRSAAFDAARVWGPSVGFMAYLNFRLSY